MAQLHEYRYTLTGTTNIGSIDYVDAELRVTNFEYFAESMVALVTFKVNNAASSCFEFQLAPGQENVSAATVDALMSQQFTNAVRTYPE